VKANDEDVAHSEGRSPKGAASTQDDTRDLIVGDPGAEIEAE